MNDRSLDKAHLYTSALQKSRHLQKGVVFLLYFGVVFQKIGQNGRPGGREPPRSISFDETSPIKSVWGRGQKSIYSDCSSARISEHYDALCQNLERNHARVSSTPPTLEERAPKVGGFAAHFACGLFEFWRGGTRSRSFVELSLILSDNNTCASSYLFVRYGRWTNLWTICLKIEPKLRQNCADKRDSGGSQNWPRRSAYFSTNRAKICRSTEQKIKNDFWKKCVSSRILGSLLKKWLFVSNPKPTLFD